MPRDVEVNVTASDKSGMALAKLEARYKAAQKRILDEAEKSHEKIGESLGKSADKAAPKISERLDKAFGGAGVSAGPLIATGLAAAAPLIGSVLSAGIIGGAGIGGVIGGVALVASDPRVKAAGSRLADNLLGTLKQDASSFVAPVIDSLRIVEGQFETSNQRIKNIFDDSSGFLEPLVRGAVRGADGVLRGIEALVDKGRPVIDAFGQSFDILGNSVGNAFETISGGSEEAASALVLVSQALGYTIEGVGYAVRGLTELSNVIGFIPNKIADTERALGILDERQGTVYTATRRVAESTGILSGALNAESAAAAQTGQSLEQLEAAQHAARRSSADLYSATTNAEQAYRDASETIKDNGRDLRKNSAAGLENRAAISRVAGALQAQYDAYVKVNGTGPKATATAQRIRDKFQALARAAGYGAGEARRLADSILDIPSNKTVNITVRTTRKGEKLYGNQAPQMAAGDSFYRGSSGDGVSRTGGPAEVRVASDVSVYLDGEPVAARARTVAAAETSRAAWRTRVGQR